MSKLILQVNDLHLVFDDTANSLKIFRKEQESSPEIFSCEIRNATTNDGFGHHGWCPRGTFLVGSPTEVHLVPFGKYFTPLFDLDPKGPLHDEGRRGVGIHGGGSGLPNPFAPRQGWQVTHGCLRVQNEDNDRIVFLVRNTQKLGRKVYITVEGQPG